MKPDGIDYGMGMTGRAGSLSENDWYEFFTVKGRVGVRYGYRTSDGQEFSCEAGTLSQAFVKRNAWLQTLKAQAA